MQLPQGYFLEDLSVGMSDSYAKTVTVNDIESFAAISGDHNPVHMDDNYAATTPFKERIAHGMLSASYISTVLGTRLPGPGCVYVSQSLQFRAPVKIGDTVEAQVTITDINHDRQRVTFETICSVGDTVVVKGEAILMVFRRSPQIQGQPVESRRKQDALAS